MLLLTKQWCSLRGVRQETKEATVLNCRTRLTFKTMKRRETVTASISIM